MGAPGAPAYNAADRIPSEAPVARTRSLLILLGASAALFACGGPPPPPPTIVELTIKAAPSINPDAEDHPSPVILRIYQLGAAGAFEKADFFQLYEKEAAALDGDLVGRDQAALAPSETKTLKIEAKPQTTVLGFLAAFRDINKAQWRAEIAVPAHQTTKVTVTLDTLAVKAAAGGS
jgi:type VI secretion system protein VasD